MDESLVAYSRGELKWTCYSDFFTFALALKKKDVSLFIGKSRDFRRYNAGACNAHGDRFMINLAGGNVLATKTMSWLT